ncbi:4Fe-4S dicluster domain-containing protein [bacterium]|nr:4Fe-4S dicluster domain-containing protein [bacterium]
MSEEANGRGKKPTLAESLAANTQVSVARCYQCGKCSAGCPLAGEMDYPPSMIMRMLQTGDPELEEKVLRSLSIWLCLSCETCATRCPMEIEITRVMEYLRSKSLELGLVNRKAKKILAFHKAFIDSVGLTGRLYEVGLVAGYKARSLSLWQDLLVAPVMFAKGKLNPFPHVIKGRSAISRIIEKAGQVKENKP